MLVVAAVIVVGVALAVWAVRAGLWVRETSTDSEERFAKRPEHTEVEEPGNQTFTPHR